MQLHVQVCSYRSSHNLLGLGLALTLPYNINVCEQCVVCGTVHNW